LGSQSNPNPDPQKRNYIKNTKKSAQKYEEVPKNIPKIPRKKTPKVTRT